MFLYKRQGMYSGNDGYNVPNTGFYYKEWAVLAAVVLSLFALVCLLRATGRRRILNNQPLLWYHKYLFPKSFRNGPPYDTNVQLTPYHHGQPRMGNHPEVSVAAPPPSYDPYATNLPAYQPAKGESSYGAHEVPAVPNHEPSSSSCARNDTQYNYTIPESAYRR